MNQCDRLCAALDFPRPVEGAARSAAATGASLLTVHASGGTEMVRAAVRGAGPGLRILAVTILTSLDAEGLALGGLAAPPRGPGPLLVVPGVRPAGAARGDQARVATPQEAVRAGADVLVLGRPLREAAGPAAA